MKSNILYFIVLLCLVSVMYIGCAPTDESSTDTPADSPSDTPEGDSSEIPGNTESGSSSDASSDTQSDASSDTQDGSSSGTSSDASSDTLTPNIDDESAGFNISKSTITTNESDGTATFTVKLSSQPLTDVVITVSSSNTTEGTVSPSSLVFTSSTWNTIQTVTLTIVNDEVDDGDQAYNLGFGITSTDSLYKDLDPSDISVLNLDDDTAGVTISSLSTPSTTEAGGTTTFTVNLDSQPLADVTISVDSSDTREGIVSINSLIFTNINWNTPQTVTVTGVDDKIADASQKYSVILGSVNSSDSLYNGVALSDINITNIGWTKQFGSPEPDWGNGIATDSSGNVYVTGNTSGSLDGHTNAGEKDIFVIKYDSSGTRQWTRQLGGTGRDEGQGIATDSSGNVYIAGATYGDLDGHTNAGEWDIFVAKYDSSGTKLWTQQLGTSESNLAVGITTDSSGNVYVTGYTTGDFDGNPIIGIVGIFLVKYDSSGIKQWIQMLRSNSLADGWDITTDSSDNVYVTGYTFGALYLSKL